MPNCKECNKELTQRPHEAKSRFLKKKFCSFGCSIAFKKTKGVNWASGQGNMEKDWLDERIEQFIAKIKALENKIEGGEQ